MKALRFRKFGPPSVLSIEEIPTPKPSDGETLVQVRAAAINPSDVKNVSGQFAVTTLPRTPGRDFSGVVVSGGGAVGEEVWGSVPGFGMTRDGVQAEYVVVPTAILSRKPRNLSMEQAAAIGVQYFKDQALAAARGGQLGPVAATAIASNPPARAAKLAAKQALNKIIDSISDSDTGKF